MLPKVHIFLLKRRMMIPLHLIVFSIFKLFLLIQLMPLYILLKELDVLYNVDLYCIVLYYSMIYCTVVL